MNPFFNLITTQSHSRARRGTLYLPNAKIFVETPVFMPVATLAAFKTLSYKEVQEMGYSLILHNAYHLTLRPGLEVISHFNGIKNMTKWNKGLLTDSGGFQVFSLEKLRKVRDEGVYFKDPIRGKTYLFTPESTIDTQITIGSDIIMPLDECTKANSIYKVAQKAQIRTTNWAKQAKKHILTKENPPALFGIVQGNMYHDLRKKSTQELVDLDFDGYSIGGLSVGESAKEMYEIAELCTILLPNNKPRYLMGVGLPENLVESVHLGIDMFDCVIPTRNARHGQAFTHLGRLNMNNAIHRLSDSPLDNQCACTTCTTYSRGYIHHLLKSKEMNAAQLLSYHNLYYLSTLMQQVRNHIDSNTFLEFRQNFYNQYQMKTPLDKPAKDISL